MDNRPLPHWSTDAGRFTAAEQSASDAVRCCPVSDAFRVSSAATLDEIEASAQHDADAVAALDELLAERTAYRLECEELRVLNAGLSDALVVAEARIARLESELRVRDEQLAALAKRCGDIDVVAAAETVAEASGTRAVITYHGGKPEDRRWYVGATSVGCGPTLAEAVADCLAKSDDEDEP